MLSSTVSTSSKCTADLKSHCALTRGQLNGPASSLASTLKPKWRKNSCSTDSISGKNDAKCMMPAASVSRNSTRRVAEKEDITQKAEGGRQKQKNRGDDSAFCGLPSAF